MYRQEDHLYNLRADVYYDTGPEGSCDVFNDKQTLSPSVEMQSPKSIITSIESMKCCGNSSHKHAHSDTFVADSNKLKTRSRQCFEHTRGWRNVTTQDSINTFVLVQDLPHCEFGVLKSFEFLDGNGFCPNPQMDRSVKPALANILTQSGQEHISGFSDDEGVFHGLKVVPNSIRKTAFNHYLP
mmetsp:Transcript_5147/g.4825  ORF Transcript_5147/g.4825 Transcript_5147/m.4825 type:complete len:184 (-) Transcript_5147:32-583(-)